MRFARTVRLVVAAGLGATALAVVGLAAPAQARVADPGPACLHPTPNAEAVAARGGSSGLDHRSLSEAEQLAIMRRTNSILAAKGVAARAGTTALASRRVPVFFHVMRDAAGRGDVSNRQIHRQMKVMNRDFAQLGFSFRLAGIDRYKNNAWHQDLRSAHYRAATRKGTARTLNIWLVHFSYLGISTFPWDYRKHRATDGIRVEAQSLPGGSIIHFNEGGTVVHETGHWLGLYHTFQGGCSKVNDQVADTPAQGSPTSGCPARRDSCPSSAGTDPIHNYMDYSWDSCYSEFTRGQAARAHKMWAAYRA